MMILLDRIMLLVLTVLLAALGLGTAVFLFVAVALSNSEGTFASTAMLYVTMSVCGIAAAVMAHNYSETRNKGRG